MKTAPTRETHETHELLKMPLNLMSGLDSCKAPGVKPTRRQTLRRRLTRLQRA